MITRNERDKGVKKSAPLWAALVVSVSFFVFRALAAIFVFAAIFIFLFEWCHCGIVDRDEKEEYPEWVP